MIYQASRGPLVILFLVWTAVSIVEAQQDSKLPTQEDLCPDYREVDPLQECQNVQSYAGFKKLVEDSPKGSSINVCPFFVQKVSSLDPIFVRQGIKVRCVRKAPDDICVINGMGHHLWIDTSDDTRWQGFSFRGSNDHAVYVAGDVDDAETSSHTFCQSSFVNNVRTKITRGGSFMAEPSSGTINIVQCLFSENFSTTYGAAIYTRTNQLNVINSIFVKNKSNGYGGAIFAASGASFMIRDSDFLGNNGREKHDVVFNPKEGTEKFHDGGGNSMNDGACRGVFDVKTGSCFFFAAPTSQPTTRPTRNPTAQPTTRPTKQPTAAPTQFPTLTASKQPTGAPKQFPTKWPTQEPESIRHTTRPTSITKTGRPAPIVTNRNTSPQPTNASRPSFVLMERTKRPSDPPVNQKTNEPTPAPTRRSATPTKLPTPIPTSVSTDGAYQNPSKAVLAPSREPTRNVYLGEEGGSLDGIPSMCSFDPFEGECIVVVSFHDFMTAINEGGEDIIFCGGFQIRKTDSSPLSIKKDANIRCLDTCTIFGTGPFIQVGGAMSKVRFSNIKFMMAETNTAVLVSTMTSLSETTFCGVEFEGNSIRPGKYGGAINVDQRSGVVNVVGSTFTDNSASKGGAIFSHGFTLNIIDSRFVANKAYDVGNAIFIAEESHVTIKSSTFILNSVETIKGSNTPNPLNYAIAVEPSKSIRIGSRRGAFVDAGKNRVIMSGDCSGYFNLWDLVCLEFVPNIS